MGKCFFCYRPTRVVPDKRPLTVVCVCVCVCACVCVRVCVCVCVRVYITTTTKMQLIVAECSHMYHDTVSTENAITPSLNYAVPRLVNGCQCL